MEPQGSQRVDIGPCLKADKTIPQSHNIFIYDPSWKLSSRSDTLSSGFPN